MKPAELSDLALEDNIGMLEFAQSEISKEMLELNRQIIQLNTRLHRCQLSKSEIDEKIRVIRERTKPPIFAGS